MSIDALQTVDIIEAMENFLSEERPQEELRHEWDVSYKIENQSVTIYYIKEDWNKPGEYREYEVAKATYVKSRKHWKVYWMRANGRWDIYGPWPVVDTIKDFIRLVDEDCHHCFWG